MLRNTIELQKLSRNWEEEEDERVLGTVTLPFGRQSYSWGGIIRKEDSPGCKARKWECIGMGGKYGLRWDFSFNGGIECFRKKVGLGRRNGMLSFVIAREVERYV